VVRHTGADALLEESVAKIQALKWSSASGELLDIDAAAEAFTSFSRAVVKALASGASQEERDALERLEPKAAVLEFLVAFGRQSKKHNSRVSVTTASLQKCKAWESFVSKNRSLLPVRSQAITTLKAREHKDEIIRVPTGASVAAAFYGDAERSRGRDVTDRVKRLHAEGKVIRASNNLFEDTVPGTQKILFVDVTEESAPARAPAPETGRQAGAPDNPGGGRKANRQSVLQQAAQVLDSTIGENGLECINGHRITKRKVGLRLHQKLEFWSVRNCDFCKEEILQNAVRWRCNEHCDFDVCESCYASGQGQDDPPLQKKSLSLSGPGLGVVRVEIPKEKIRKDPSGILFYEVIVTPTFSENSPPVYSVSRRYNEFEALNRNLGPEARNLRPTFPPKLYIKSEEKLEERRSDLSQWLQAAVAHPASSGTWRELLRRFLRYEGCEQRAAE
jgi:hypothetical protein